jgi:hypothetical protein
VVAADDWQSVAVAIPIVAVAIIRYPFVSCST